jgi:hypothetical protein
LAIEAKALGDLAQTGVCKNFNSYLLLKWRG